MSLWSPSAVPHVEENVLKTSEAQLFYEVEIALYSDFLWLQFDLLRAFGLTRFDIFRSPWRPHPDWPLYASILPQRYFFFRFLPGFILNEYIIHLSTSIPWVMFQWFCCCSVLISCFFLLNISQYNIFLSCSHSSVGNILLSNACCRVEYTMCNYCVCENKQRWIKEHAKTIHPECVMTVSCHYLHLADSRQKEQWESIIKGKDNMSNVPCLQCREATGSSRRRKVSCNG